MKLVQPFSLLLVKASGVVLLLVFLAFESSSHFSLALLKHKKEIFSAQKNWNLFYGQSNVYLNGGLRHADDFKALEGVLEPGSGLVTDLATSYYLAASLPVYVKNVHKHHGLYTSQPWSKLFTHRIVCYLDAPENFSEFQKVMRGESKRSLKEGIPPVRYIAVNRTHYNDNFKRGCLSQRRRGMLSVIDQLGEPVFDGETISVYRLSASSSK